LFYIFHRSIFKFLLYNCRLSIDQDVSSEINQLITKYFMYDFPEVKIITENGEVKGQLRDILNKSIVTVSEKDKIKAISWDKIEIIEASKKDLKNDFRSP